MSSTFFALIIAFIVAVVVLTKQTKKIEAKANIECVSDKRIAVSKQAEINKSVIHIRRYQETSLQYNPAKITYTGATVGGVTTGGLDYQDAYYSVKGGNITNKFIMYFEKSDKESMIVDEIELSPNLVDKAKKDPNLSKYLRGNVLYITKPSENKWGSTAAQTLKTTGNYALASDIAMKDYASTLLTKSELAPIYNFICALSGDSLDGDNEASNPEEKYICTVCGTKSTGWYQSCPKCGALNKMKKIGSSGIIVGLKRA